MNPHPIEIDPSVCSEVRDILACDAALWDRSCANNGAKLDFPTEQIQSLNPDATEKEAAFKTQIKSAYREGVASSAAGETSGTKAAQTQLDNVKSVLEERERECTRENGVLRLRIVELEKKLREKEQK